MIVGTGPDLRASAVVKLRPEKICMPSVSKKELDTLSRVVFRNASDWIFCPDNATEVFNPIRCIKGALAKLALRTPGSD